MHHLISMKKAIRFAWQQYLPRIEAKCSQTVDRLLGLVKCEADSPHDVQANFTQAGLTQRLVATLVAVGNRVKSLH